MLVELSTIWVFRKDLGDTNETWCLSLFLGGKNEAQLPHYYLCPGMTVFPDDSQSVKWQDLRLLIIS